MISLRRSINAAAKKVLPSALAGLAFACFSLGILTAPFAIYTPLKLLAAGFYAFALYWLIYRPPLHFPPIKPPLAAFLWTSLISTWYWWAASLPINRMTWYRLLIFGIIPLAGNVIVSARQLKALCQVFFLESLAGGLLAIWQFIQQYRAGLAQNPGHLYLYMTGARRYVRGFTPHPVFFGGQQMLFFVVLLAFLLFSARAAKIWWGVLAIIGISIALSFTRSAWLGCFVAVVYLLARWRPRRLWLLPVALAIGYLAAPSLIRHRVKSIISYSNDLSVAHRFELWHVGLRMIRKHPWVGVGPDNIDTVYMYYLPAGQTPIGFYRGHLHSNFLQFAAERGLPALGAWFWLMLTLLWQFWKMRPILSEMRWVADAGIAAWLAMMVQGCFDYNFGIFSVLVIFLFFASAPFVAQEIETRRLTLPGARG